MVNKKSVKKIIFATTLFMLSVVFMTQNVSAFSGADFKAGRITDDAIFFSTPNMSIAEIQAFLNAKIPNCDTNGTQPYGGTTRAAYAATKGVSAPFTCLKDYWQTTPNRGAEFGLCNGYNGDNQSAASIIYWVAESCGVNPRVLLVLLQKEQSLLTDDWPWPIQYRSATGYGCPDTAPCDAEYYGFFNQVYAAARQYKRYARDATSFNYRAGRNNYIQYNPNAGCGGSQIFIENQATAGLYNYTPYQPNAAALNNLYGEGDGCSAYGNRNYWRMYYDWFGAPINDIYAWEVVRETGTPKLYLVINHKKHHIPSESVYTAWGLDRFSFRDIDSGSLGSFSAGPSLDYVAVDGSGTRYLMTGGKKVRLGSDAAVLAWGVANVPHISAPGLLTQISSGGDATRFANDGTSIYLLDGNSKRRGINSSSLSYWGYNNNATLVDAPIISRMPTGTAVDRFVSIGSTKYVIDDGKALQTANSSFAAAWGSHTYVGLDGYSVALLSKQTVGNFVADPAGRWYYLENGRKHYVGSEAVARAWGWNANNPVVPISNGLMSGLTASSNLGVVAYSTDDNKAYVVDGKKHYIPSENVLNNWTGGQSVPGFSETAFSLLNTGANASSAVVKFDTSPNVYTVNSGQFMYVPNMEVYDAVGANRNQPLFTASGTISSLVSKSGTIESIVKDNSGNGYYLENGYARPIDPDFASTWQVSSAPTISGTLLSTFTESTDEVGYKLSVNGRRYLMNNRNLIDVTSDYANFGLTTSGFVTVNRTYFPVRNPSHLIGVTNSNKIWLLASGRRYHIPTYGMLVDLGYDRHSGILSLNPIIANTIPEDPAPAIRVIRWTNSGAVFAVNGVGLGFGSASTLNAYLGARNPLVVPQSVFDKFAFSGWAARVVAGPNRIYVIEGGLKRWIAGPAILWSRFGNEPWLSLSQESIDAFPEGTAITN